MVNRAQASILKTLNVGLMVIIATLFVTSCAQQSADTSNNTTQDSTATQSLTKREHRTDGEIQAVFDKNKVMLYRIYNRELQRKPELAGRVVLYIEIQPSGLVSRCIIKSSTLGDNILEQKIVDGVKGVNFGSKQAPVTKIIYPLEFFKPVKKNAS